MGSSRGLVGSRCHAGEASARSILVSLVIALYLATYVSNLSNFWYEELCWESGRVTVALTEGVLDHTGEDYKVPAKISQVHSYP